VQEKMDDAVIAANARPRATQTQTNTIS
jgi:hypothetical protein